MATSQLQSLASAIEGYREGFKQKVPQEIQAQMIAVTRSLEAAHLADNALNVGDSAPDFTLPNATDKVIRLSELLQEGPVVINFYRGEWCPYCNLELRAFQQLLPEFKQAGAQLVSISPELPDHSLSVTEKHELEFEVLSDLGNGVAKQFGLVFTLDPSLRPIYQSFGIDIPTSNGDETYELPMPATYVVDTSGMIRYAFADADYTKRAEPQDALDAVKALS